MDAVNTLGNRYHAVKKELRLRHLSAHCHKQMMKASMLVKNVALDDPRDD